MRPTHLHRRLAALLLAATLVPAVPAAAEPGAAPPPPKGGAPTTIKVTTTADTTDVDVRDGKCRDREGRCSLRAAVTHAHTVGGEVTIQLAKDTTYALSLDGPGEDHGQRGDLDVRVPLRIVGEGSAIRGREGDRVIDAFAPLTLEGLTIIDGSPPAGEDGGLVRAAASLTVRDATFFGGVTAAIHDDPLDPVPGHGGAIEVSNGTLVVERTMFHANHGESGGGAIALWAGDHRTSTLRDVTFSANTTGPAGFHLVDGTVQVDSGVGGGLLAGGRQTVVVERGTFRQNTAGHGGGIHVDNETTVQLTDSEVVDNEARGGRLGGGGIAVHRGSLRLDEVVVEHNHSDTRGGGVASYDAHVVELRRSSLTDNHAPGGGGLAAYGTDWTTAVTIAETKVAGNVARRGGGIQMADNVQLVLAGSSVTKNLADDGDGGGIQVATSLITPRLEIVESTIAGNVASSRAVVASGGGLAVDGGVVDVRDSVVDDNLAQRAGGILARGSQLTVRTTRVIANEARADGGGILLDTSEAELVDGVITDNRAGAQGGGLWCRQSDVRSTTLIDGNDAPVGDEVHAEGCRHASRSRAGNEEAAPGARAASHRNPRRHRRR